MRNSFWPEHNRWWAHAARQMMCTGLQGERLATAIWLEAGGKLRSLSYRVLECAWIHDHERADLVQEMLLALQDNDLLTKLSVMDAPAHYLSEMMRNSIRGEQKRRRRARRTAPRYAKQVEAPGAEQPDQQAAHKELCARARFIVNHVLRADDRKVLWWFYRDELSVAQISERLGITEVAALQRLSRARRRLREAFGD